jgi:hypothetical protein
VAAGRGVTLLRAFALLGLLVPLAGCSGKSSQSDGSDDSGGSPDESGGTSGLGGTAGQGGTSAQGGTAGSMQAAKLGLNMMLRNSDPNLPEVAGRTCPTSTGVEWDIGERIVSDGVVVDVDSPTPTDFGSTLEDGTDGASVACSVLPDGTFEVDGGGNDPQITPPGGLINFTMNGAANARGGTNVRGLAVYTPLTLSLATAEGFPPCGMTNVHEMTPGALWADFDCPALTNPSEPTIACHASGTIVIEYCRAQ